MLQPPDRGSAYLWALLRLQHTRLERALDRTFHQRVLGLRCMESLDQPQQLLLPGLRLSTLDVQLAFVCF